LKSFLLMRTVVPAVCNMGERVLLTVQALSELAKTRAKREREITVKPRETRTSKPKIMMRGWEEGGIQLTGSVGVVGGDDEFSWC